MEIGELHVLQVHRAPVPRASPDRQLVLYLIALGRVVEEIQRVPLPRRTSGCGGGNREKQVVCISTAAAAASRTAKKRSWRREQKRLLQKKLHDSFTNRLPHSLLEF
ncbi:unnamed protein product [Ectocarpus sp. CCAP 1310/34]|nr:unnamed protein product [Ectocarpus sp. CCAP 1310/34]